MEKFTPFLESSIATTTANRFGSEHRHNSNDINKTDLTQDDDDDKISPTTTT